MKTFFAFIIAIFITSIAIGQTDSITTPIDYSKFLTKRVSVVDNEVTIETPSLDLSITKVIGGGVTTYYLYVRTYDSYCTAGCTGVKLLFNDGTKWIRPNERVDMDASYDSFRYSAFIRLTQADLITFSTKTVTAYKLYIFERTVTENDAEMFRKTTEVIRRVK